MLACAIASPGHRAPTGDQRTPRAFQVGKGHVHVGTRGQSDHTNRADRTRADVGETSTTETRIETTRSVHPSSTLYAIGDLWVMSRALGVSALRTSARYTRAICGHRSRTVSRVLLRIRPNQCVLVTNLVTEAPSGWAIRLLGDPPAEREDTRRFSRR